MPDHCEATDNIHYPADLRDRKANILPSIVELGETTEATEYNGAALKRWKEVLMDQASQVLQPGYDCLVPALVTLGSSLE